MARNPVNRGARNTRGNRNNRANQMNPNNDAYWKARGHDKKPIGRDKASSTRKNTD